MRSCLTSIPRWPKSAGTLSPRRLDYSTSPREASRATSSHPPSTTRRPPRPSEPSGSMADGQRIYRPRERHAPAPDEEHSLDDLPPQLNPEQAAAALDRGLPLLLVHC